MMPSGTNESSWIKMSNIYLKCSQAYYKNNSVGWKLPKNGEIFFDTCKQAGFLKLQ